jgi:hypothetical protein
MTHVAFSRGLTGHDQGLTPVVAARAMVFVPNV